MLRRSAPINKLPTELLSHIFLLGAPRPPAEPEEDHPRREVNDLSPCMAYSYAFPCLVSTVNRHWRGVAISTGQLWSKIAVVDEDTDDMSDLEGSCFKLARLFLSRSGTAPLDIMIDARDPEWNFSEFDIFTAGNTPGDDEDEYKHPFTQGHMRVAMQMLLPHLHRCRTLAIFTDRWAPMHIALSSLSVDAPRAASLESLILMRCNEFAAYSPEFTPHEFAGHWFLPFGNRSSQPAFPRLDQLVLSGVHIKWKALPSMLEQPSRLRHLELTYHCSEVRPNKAEFWNLFRACPELEELIVRVSLPEDDAEFGQEAAMQDVEPVTLPKLNTLKVGYDDGIVTQEFMELFRAPNLRTLVLEDASDVASEEEEDASRMLVYCAHAGGRNKHSLVPLFPSVEAVELSGTRASLEAFQTFYSGLTRLHSLMLRDTPVASTRALRPSSPHVTPRMCPCPLLDTLIVRGFEPCEDAVLSEVLVERTNYGAVFRDIRLEPWFGLPENDDHDVPVGEDERAGFYVMPNGQPVMPWSPRSLRSGPGFADMDVDIGIGHAAQGGLLPAFVEFVHGVRDR